MELGQQDEDEGGDDDVGLNRLWERSKEQAAGRVRGRDATLDQRNAGYWRQDGDEADKFSVHHGAGDEIGRRPGVCICL